MSYTVVWKRALKQKLAEVWISAPDRAAVSTAANTIDLLLRAAPLDQGEARSGNTRILIVPPLAVVYEIHADDRRVEVLALRNTTNRPPGNSS